VHCFVCAEHASAAAMPGGIIAGDENVVVTHLPLVTAAGEADSVYLGHLFVETRRHVSALGDLEPDEAQSVGLLTARAARALRESQGAEHVYAAVIGHGIDHFHLHVIPRYPATPREYWWTRVDEWPGAPRGAAAQIKAVAGRLRQAMRTD
jgi:diadenosine tetraphosphate (Ap4A) HIT family hydrolase